MKIAWQEFKKHPISIISYLIFLIIFIQQIRIELDFQRIIAQHHGKWPYGVREWDGMLFFLYAIVFVIVALINAVAAKKPKFYWWLILFILLPVFILGHLFT
jgi:hypothetical protein